MSAALSNADLPAAWFDAVTETDAERDEIQYEANGARMEARVKDKIGWAE